MAIEGGEGCACTDNAKIDAAGNTRVASSAGASIFALSVHAHPSRLLSPSGYLETGSAPSPPMSLLRSPATTSSCLNPFAE